MFGSTSGSGGFSFGGASITATTTATTASTPQSAGFTFGTQPQAMTGGFTFTAPPSLTTQPAAAAEGTTGFSFGGTAKPAATAPAGGFSFGTTPNTPATTSIGFGVGGAVSSQAAPTTGTTNMSGFSFAPTTPASSVFPFGGTKLGTATTGQQKSVGFALPIVTTAAPTTANSGFMLGGTPTVMGVRPTITPTVAPTGSFTVGGPGAVTQRLSVPLPGTMAATTVTTGFTVSTPLANLPVTSTSTATKHTLAGTPAQSAFGSIKLGTTTTAATLGTSTGFTPGVSTTATPASTELTQGGAVTSSAAPAAGFGYATAASMAATTGTTKTTASLPQMNYQQLEEAINKWTVELEEQEKIFLQQATQVNAWDRLLIENGEKITTLNSDVERVKLDQQRLDNELDFIRAQQRELEELLSPLEDAVQELPSISYQQHADLEREHTYQLSENIDAQLKRMVKDLKDIIDHVNSTNTGQDNNDPIHQITKILNAHMDSLQWIDHNSGLLNRRVEEISRQMDSQRKEQERNFRLAYD